MDLPRCAAYSANSALREPITGVYCLGKFGIIFLYRFSLTMPHVINPALHKKASHAPMLVGEPNTHRMLMIAVIIAKPSRGTNFMCISQRGFFRHLVQRVFCKNTLLYNSDALLLGSVITLYASPAHSAWARSCALAFASSCFELRHDEVVSCLLQTILPAAKLISPQCSHFQLA